MLERSSDNRSQSHWIPAYAGMTTKTEVIRGSLQSRPLCASDQEKSRGNHRTEGQAMGDSPASGSPRLRIPRGGRCRIVSPRWGGRTLPFRMRTKGVPCRRRGGRDPAGTAAVLQTFQNADASDPIARAGTGVACRLRGRYRPGPDRFKIPGIEPNSRARVSIGTGGQSAPGAMHAARARRGQDQKRR